MPTGRRPGEPGGPSQRASACARHCVDRVVADFERLWSPEQIARRLRAEFSDDPELWVPHETIYKSIYVPGRGELRRELAPCLRTGRAKRRSQGRMEKRGRIADMVIISERPAEAKDRAVPGHWEGDLIIGKDGKSAIGTLVKRSTRFVILLHLAGDRSAGTVRAAIAAAIATSPATLQRAPLPLAARLQRDHPTAFCASTFPRAPISRCTAPRSSRPPPTASTAALDTRSAG